MDTRQYSKQTHQKKKVPRSDNRRHVWAPRWARAGSDHWREYPWPVLRHPNTVNSCGAKMPDLACEQHHASVGENSKEFNHFECWMGVWKSCRRARAEDQHTSQLFFSELDCLINEEFFERMSTCLKDGCPWSFVEAVGKSERRNVAVLRLSLSAPTRVLNWHLAGSRLPLGLGHICEWMNSRVLRNTYCSGIVYTD